MKKAGRPSLPESQKKKTLRVGVRVEPEIEELYKKHKHPYEKWTPFFNRVIRERFQKEER